MADSKVTAALKQLGLEKFTTKFADEDIDWDGLLTLSKEDLKSMGCSIGATNKIAAFIAEQHKPTGDTHATEPPTKKAKTEHSVEDTDADADAMQEDKDASNLTGDSSTTTTTTTTTTRPLTGAEKLDFAKKELKRIFGYDGLRPGQSEAIPKILDSESVLCVFPTGSGKSMCYQLPAIVNEGYTLVVSPLIALMKDQVDWLTKHDVPAGRLDTSLDYEARHTTSDAFEKGELKLFYVSPEKLSSESFQARLKRRPPSVLAVDEAHCISEWGHNFRPEYLKLASIRNKLQIPQVILLTATATPKCIDDIVKQFKLDRKNVVNTGFHRKNLEVVVSIASSGAEAQEELTKKIKSKPRGSMLIYAGTHKQTREVCAALDWLDPKPRIFHGLLPAAEKTETQEWFMKTENATVVATIAFGMGVDKSNVRYVYHFNCSKCPESYLQEIGRAGRDGKPAYCEMWIAPEHLAVNKNFIYGDAVERTQVKDVVQHALDLYDPDDEDDGFHVYIKGMAGEHDIHESVLKTMFTHMELEDWLQETDKMYGEYKIRPKPGFTLQTLGNTLDTRTLAKQVVQQHTSWKRVWGTVDVGGAVATSGCSRKQVIRVLDMLENVEASVECQPTTLYHGYRWLPAHKEVTIDKMVDLCTEKQQKSEKVAIQRLLDLVDLADETKGCITKRLLAYFGEQLEGTCGHCGVCSGAKVNREAFANCHDSVVSDQDTWNSASAEVDDKHIEILLDEYPWLLPVQIARVLTGVSSPRLTNQGLKKHGLWERYHLFPFNKVRDVAAKVKATYKPAPKPPQPKAKPKAKAKAKPKADGEPKGRGRGRGRGKYK